MGYESKVMVVENYKIVGDNEYRHIVAEVNLGSTVSEIVNAFDIDTGKEFYIEDSGWTIELRGESEIRVDRYGDSFKLCSDPLKIVDVVNHRFIGKDYGSYADSPDITMLCAMILAYSEGFKSGSYELIHYGY